MRIQVVVTYDQRLWVGGMKLFNQFPQTAPLCLGTRVGRSPSDVQPTLVADAYRVGVMAYAVGTDHPFRPARLNRAVASHHIMVADAELPAPLAVVSVNLVGR